MTRKLKAVAVTVAITGLSCSYAFAAGRAEKGKALFNDPKFAGGTSGSSCSSCHPDGKGLEKAGMKGKHTWTNPAGTWLKLEDANNVCIVVALKGKAIDPKGAEMKDLVAYEKSLAKKKGGTW